MPQYFTYRNWDGTQQILPFDADAIMEAISEDLLGDGDLKRALRRLMQQGYQPRDQERMMGLRDMMERLRQRRQEMLKRNNLGGMMDEVNKKLEEIIQTERQGIERRVEEGRQKLQQNQQESSEGQQPSAQEGAPDAEQQAALQKMMENMAARRQQQLDALPEDATRLLWLCYSLVNASFPVEVWRQPRVPDSGAASMDVVVEPAI
jgi:hypothetical protein